jgi:hypothetical protein
VPLTQLQEQTALSLARMRPAHGTLFERLDWAVWSSCTKAMEVNLAIGLDDLAEFRRLTREPIKTN